jgi:hypothetical protein
VATAITVTVGMLIALRHKKVSWANWGDVFIYGRQAVGCVLVWQDINKFTQYPHRRVLFIYPFAKKERIKQKK